MVVLANHKELRPLLNEKEAAKYLSVSRSFLRMGRCYGHRKGRTETPPFIRIGRAIRYAVEDLEAWIARNRCECVAPTSEGKE